MVAVNLNVPSPVGVRLARAKVAFQTFSECVWGTAADFDQKADWVKEIWAQVADAAIKEPSHDLAAMAACNTRCRLEDRKVTWSDVGPFGRTVWKMTATKIRSVQ